MATSVVGSLFGPSPEDLRREQIQQDLVLSQNAQRISPYYGAGYGIGMAIGRGIEGLFGIKNPSIKRAEALDQALKTAQASLSPADRNNRGMLFSKVADILGEIPEFQREAIQAQAQAAQFIKEDTEAAADLAYKKGLTEYYNVLQTDKAAEIEGKKLERQGQVAFGGLNSLQRSKDPAAQTKIWENTLTALEKQGLDISTIKDIPWEQRQTVLEGIVDSSESSATRVKAEVAGMKQEFAAIQQEERVRHNQAIEALSAQKMQLMEQLSDKRIASAERIALENKVNGINAQMERLDKTNAWRTQGQFTSQIGTKEFDKTVKGYLREELGFGDKEISKVLPQFNAAYGKYLGTKDENGYPRYSSQEALNLAKKEIEGDTSKVTKTFAGFEVPGTTKPVYKGGSSKKAPSVINLD